MSDPDRVGLLHAIRANDLSPEQERLWSSVADGPRGAAPWMVNDGVLAGPFNAWLHVPEVGAGLAHAGEYLRFSSSLSPDVREIIIMTVGAHWRSEFEFWAHSGIARDEGVADAVIDAIAVGDRAAVLSHSTPVAAAAYVTVCSLLDTGHVSESALADLVAVVGEATAVEAVTLAGYYTCVSFTLNAFAVPLPDGVLPRFGEVL